MHENKLNIETNKFYHDKLYNKQGDTDLIKIALPAYIKNFTPKIKSLFYKAGDTALQKKFMHTKKAQNITKKFKIFIKIHCIKN